MPGGSWMRKSRVLDEIEGLVVHDAVLVGMAFGTVRNPFTASGCTTATLLVLAQA